MHGIESVQSRFLIPPTISGGIGKSFHVVNVQVVETATTNIILGLIFHKRMPHDSADENVQVSYMR